MSQFNYEDYQKVVAKAQNPYTNAVKIGFFKLGDGQEALVRINVSKLDDLKFATVHAPVFGKKFEGLGSGFTPVMCLNEVGSYSDACPFCKAAAEGHEVIGKAAKKVYVQMLVSYKENGQFSAAVPVVWERPAGFSKELAAKLRDYENLAAHVFKITRIGAGKDTKYSLDYIPLYDKPETVPADFSAFNNFDLTKHSFWVKTADELAAFVATGSFPATESKPAEGSKNLDKVINSPAEEAKVEAALGMAPEATLAPTPTSAPAPVATPVTEEKPAERPARNFTGFSF
jgi:hypothetical protein